MLSQFLLVEFDSVVVSGGTVRVRSGARCSLQGLRRAFAERRSVLNREAPQFQETKAGGNLCHSCGAAICVHQRASCPGQSQHSKMPAGRKTTDSVKGLAKRPLADREGGAKSRDLEGLVNFGERQNLSPFNEVPTGIDGQRAERACPNIDC
jgi:hypothetical protein